MKCRRPTCERETRGKLVYCGRLCKLLDRRRVEFLYRRRPDKYKALREDIERMMPISTLDPSARFS